MVSHFITSLAAFHWNAFQFTKSIVFKALPLKIPIWDGRIAQKVYVFILALQYIYAIGL